ncbi:MAG: tyrosine-type recombinase/integrase [Bacteroidota bacterium]
MSYIDNRHSITHIFDRFLEHNRCFKNYSKSTVCGYRDTFKLFSRTFHVSDIKDVNRTLMEDFFYYGRTERNWSAVTYHFHFKHFNVFYKWCVKRELLEVNPMQGIDKPPLEHRLPRRLTSEQSEKVLEASFHMKYSYRFERFRNRAIIGCMLLAGLRKSEVIRLRFQDVDMKSRTLFLNQSKGHKDRIVPISSRLFYILEEYVKERKRLNRKSICFFTGVNENRTFGVQALKILFRRLREVTKLNFSAHTLRHSFATLTLEGGCDIYTLSQLMGHSKITTTTIYLQCTNHQKRRGIERNGLNHL